MVSSPPFVIVALPRSRTYWLSRALSYGNWTCWHEHAPNLRSLEDIRCWLSQDFTGSSETTVAPFWRTILKVRPDTRMVVVRRPVNEVVDSLMRLDLRGVCVLDRAKITRIMQSLDRKLDQIEARVPGVLSVQYSDLSSELTFARVFKHCLCLSHDHAWWTQIEAQNLQFSMAAQMRYMLANIDSLNKLAATVKRSTLTDIRPRKIVNRDDVTIQQESCEAWFRDGIKLFEEHSIQLGEAPDGYLRRNWNVMMAMDRIGAMQIMTARCNGRMVGYYVCYISPATDDASLISSLHISIFVSKDFYGIGTRLQRASLDALRDKGVGEICFRAGVNADGPRMGAIYERAGAENIGQMYRLALRRA